MCASALSSTVLHMSRLDDTFVALATAFRGLGLRWYVFGAQAAIFHGIARATADIDVTVDPGGRSTTEIASALSVEGFALRTPDDDFVAKTRVLPVAHRDTHVPVDVVFAGPGLEDLFFERVIERKIGALTLPIAAAEDLIVMKILAGRPKDLEDIRAIVSANPDLDAATVRETLSLLEQALDQRDLMPVFERAWKLRRARGRTRRRR